MPRSAILPTKLHRPPLPSGWVNRPALLQRLTDGFRAGRLITLVSAPAGFGKSTCVSEWVDSMEGIPAAWLSLDPSDDDPVCFFSYFLAALQTVDKNLGRDVSGVLAAGEIPPADSIAATLIGDILKLKGPFIIVLDDFHLIQDNVIYQILGKLISSPPPQLRLVLLTREDPPLPLARFRANNRLTEIRAADLRFSTRDAEAFLNQSMNLSLSENDITVLEEKTEGWIAGLQLAALALQSLMVSGREKNPSAFIASLNGSHRFILNYLTEQVLEEQSEETRDFLLQTSILDTLSGDVCDAVTGRTDSLKILERLLKNNLFLISLDDEGHWYRYHHLFTDLLRGLRKTIKKDLSAELHRRACRWYIQEGIHDAAVEHALAAEDYSTALDLLEHHASDLIMQGHVKTLDNWIHALPPEEESHSPRINLAFAWMHILRGSVLRAEPYLKRLESILDDYPAGKRHADEYNSLRAEWDVIQSLIAYGQGKMVNSLETARQALATAPEGDSRVLSLAYYAQGSALCTMEEYTKAEEAFRASLQHARSADNQIAEMLSSAGLTIMAFEHGQMHLAVEIINPAVERLEHSDSQPSMSCVIYGSLAEIFYQWYRLKEARRYMFKAFRLSVLGDYVGRIGCRVFFSRLDMLEGNLEQAASEIREAVYLIEEDAPAFIVQEAAAQQTRLHLTRGHFDSAVKTLKYHGFSFEGEFVYPEISPDDCISYSSGLLYNSSLHIILYQLEELGGDSLLLDGIRLAGSIIDTALRHRCILVAIEAFLLRSRLYMAVNNNPPGTEAREDIVRALELAQPEGVIGVFVEQGKAVQVLLTDLMKGQLPANLSREYTGRILSLCSGPSSSGGTQLPAAETHKTEESRIPVESLTDRELEVLNLIMKGMKYQEIADILFVSLNTIRFHVKSIYSKLNVDNRTKAIAKAKNFKLI